MGSEPRGRFASRPMPETEFVHAGMRLTKLVVNTLAMSELDAFVEACQQQVDEDGNEDARYALATAEAAVQFRDEVRKLSTAPVGGVQ